ncbi:hypothetical protein HanXRQr2_Chr12g0550141 [Helianthus annuus]|uniref:Uncharacterized protein n=1 Tax=Helianthus annuus TaxID=4232 RepID=A0A9K3HHX5_HELAN|nr:hypothetical protein HanXRQr2_Chr12g0550141 [Helianthus annuus]KAJ0863411.1 hypothetical protein HanPSC8_Chr12g0529681 [Helianthus annuus]
MQYNFFFLQHQFTTISIRNECGYLPHSTASLEQGGGNLVTSGLQKQSYLIR